MQIKTMIIPHTHEGDDRQIDRQMIDRRKEKRKKITSVDEDTEKLEHFALLITL